MLDNYPEVYSKKITNLMCLLMVVALLYYKGEDMRRRYG